MNQLLNDLITTPTVFGIILIVSLLLLILLAILTNVYNDKHPYRKNPFIISFFVTLITLLTVSIGTRIRLDQVESKPLDYVKIQKTTDNIVIISQTMFINSINLPIKESINDGVIVEYNGNEYVIRNNQLN